MANTPQQDFKYLYSVFATDTPGTYRVGMRGDAGSSHVFQPPYFRVSDSPDGNADDLGRLGDVPGDLFKEDSGLGFVSSVEFVGTTPDGKNFIGILDAPVFGKITYLFSDDGSYAEGSTVSVTSAPFTIVPVCFASGTLIRTMRGDVAVEDLSVGDLAVTASGEPRPVVWLGHRTIECPAGSVPHDVCPVRIQVGAFGSDTDGDPVPERSLFLSPGHTVLVGPEENEVLVPIMCLINGTSIARVPVAAVTCWHVELDVHDILLAEGLPAESYLDWGDRTFFTEGAGHALANPDFVVPGLGGRCRPVAVDGPVVEAERRRLDALFAMRLSGACAWPSAEDAGGELTWSEAR